MERIQVLQITRESGKGEIEFEDSSFVNNRVRPQLKELNVNVILWGIVKMRGGKGQQRNMKENE